MRVNPTKYITLQRASSEDSQEIGMHFLPTNPSWIILGIPVDDISMTMYFFTMMQSCNENSESVTNKSALTKMLDNKSTVRCRSKRSEPKFQRWILSVLKKLLVLLDDTSIPNPFILCANYNRILLTIVAQNDKRTNTKLLFLEKLFLQQWKQVGQRPLKMSTAWDILKQKPRACMPLPITPTVAGQID